MKGDWLPLMHFFLLVSFCLKYAELDFQSLIWHIFGRSEVGNMTFAEFFII